LSEPRRSTIYLEPDLHRALRMKAAATDRSISELVNEAVRSALAEDAEDLRAFSERAEESAVEYETLLERLERDGTI
jgi:plasmid stability protein